MGYYTVFKGRVVGSGPVMAKFEEDAENDDSFGSDGWEFPLQDFLETYINDGEQMSWYHHDADVLALSNKYPNLLFSLHGDGEEQGDQWKKFYRNGKMVQVKAVVTFPEIDLDKELPMDNTVEREIREQQRQKLLDELAGIQRKLAELDA